MTSDTPQHQRLTYEQAEQLAVIIQTQRPDWNTAGIITALEVHVADTDALTLTAAITHTALNPQNRTPAALHHTGPHWVTHTPSTAHTPPCPIPDHHKAGRKAHNCPECWKLHDFPATITHDTWTQLDPAIQKKIHATGNTTITDSPG